MDLKSETSSNQKQSKSLSNQLFEYAKLAALDLEPNFVIDKNIESVMKALSLYFSNNPEFENFGFGKLDKGIYLIGNVGVGKTLLIKAFAKSIDNSFIVVSANSVNDQYQLNGIEGIEKYIKPTFQLPGRRAYCFDDIGVEPCPIKHMGNELKVMERIILDRYENKLTTFFTSNLGADDIEKMYGTRIRSRIREMCNFMIVPGTDRRK